VAHWQADDLGLEGRNEAAAKLTYIASQRHTLNFRFASRTCESAAIGFNTMFSTIESAREARTQKDYQFTASAISVLSPTLVNDLRFQASTRRAVHEPETRSAQSRIVGIARGFFTRRVRIKGSAKNAAMPTISTSGRACLRLVLQRGVCLPEIARSLTKVGDKTEMADAVN